MGDDENSSRLDAARRWVFAATFTNYAMAHWTRKCYTNVKVQLMAVGVSAYTLAAMDSAFMFTYALGSFITGPLGDRFSPSAVVGIGLLGSTACLFLITAGSEIPAIAGSAGSLGLAWFAGTQFFHGFFQATGGPVNTAIMGNWFPKKGRGLVFGLWTCHQYTGDIVAAVAGAYILDSGWLDWRMAMVIPLVLNGAWGLVNFTCVPNTPADLGLETGETIAAASAKAKALEEAHGLRHAEAQGAGTQHPAPVPKDSASPPAIGIKEAFLLPNVMGYAIAFGFFKLINYAMFFQLPVILSANFDPATANIVSALYSVGMMPGGIVCGWVSDLYGGRRACVCATMMVLLVPLLLVLAFFMESIPTVSLLVLLCFMGCLVGGPNNIITSAVAADLADDPSIAGSAKALGTVTGIINGSGSVTAAFGQLAIPVLSAWGVTDGVGYRYVWLFLVLCTCIGTALLGPKITRELFEDESPAPPTAGTGLAASGGSGYQSISNKEATVEMKQTRTLV